MKRFGLLAALATAFFLGLAGPVTATVFHVGIGFSQADNAEEGISEAYEQAFKALGEKTPRLILVTENYTGGRQGRNLIPLILEKAKGIPMVGAGLGEGDYTAQSPKTVFVRKRGINVLALAGDFEFQAETVAMGPVVYPNDRDRRNNPEKFAADEQTMIDNRQKPGAELGKKFQFGPDQNLLLIFGQLHNPEITYFAKGLDEVVPANITIAGAACQNGSVYHNGEALRSAALGVLIKGKFQIAQSMVGQFWDGQNLDKHFAGILKETAIDAVPQPDLVLGILCGSWHRGPIDAQHKALVETLGKDAPYYGTYGGGELGRMKNRRGEMVLTGTGGCGVVTAIKGIPAGSATAPASMPAK